VQLPANFGGVNLSYNPITHEPDHTT
jgi:hypothetical protein